MAFRRYMGLAVALLICSSAHAATLSVTAHVAFEAPLTLVEDTAINFGTLQAATSGTYVIDTKGAIKASNGGVVLGGTPVHGQLSISGSATQTVVISTSSYTASGGVTPSQATCEYDGTAIASCDAGGASMVAPGGAGKVLKLGVKIEVDGTQTPGSTATPSFVVAVIYG